jgi:hypothetical protein
MQCAVLDRQGIITLSQEFRKITLTIIYRQRSNDI